MGTVTSLDFREVNLKLRAYLEATDGDIGKFVRRVVSEQIDVELEQNPGINARFEQRRAALVEKGNVADISPKQRRRAKKQTHKSTGESKA
jgi:hypothetical protein